jgi:PAS domain S-box-containing protein
MPAIRRRACAGPHNGRMADVTNWLQHAIDTTKDYAVILLDQGGRIIEWRGAAENVFGYSAAEAVGKPFSMLFTPETRAS